MNLSSPPLFLFFFGYILALLLEQMKTQNENKRINLFLFVLYIFTRLRTIVAQHIHVSKFQFTLKCDINYCQVIIHR